VCSSKFSELTGQTELLATVGKDERKTVRGRARGAVYRHIGTRAEVTSNPVAADRAAFKAFKNAVSKTGTK
jgi:hypothetical protein